MGRIGKIIKSFIDKLSGSNTDAQFASVEEFSGDDRTVQIFGPCNEDFAPPENCETLDSQLSNDRGYLVSHAYHNKLILPVAKQGEFRKYSTNQAGDTVMAELFLKQDGTILIKNAKITITLNPSGLLEFESNGNSEFTSLKTIFNNNVDVIGLIDSTVSVTAPNIYGTTDVLFGPTNKSTLTHNHSQANDGNGDNEVDTSVPL